MTQTFCSYYNQNECRSCKWIEVPYAKQILQKEERLKNALAFYPDFEFRPSVLSNEVGFRNKAKLSVTGTALNPILGITGRDVLDQGHALLHCPIHHPKLNELISALPGYITEFNLIPYQIATQTGELKGLILFYSEATDEMILRFVLRSKECVSRIQKLLPKLQADFPNLRSVSANLQPVPHAILEGPEEIYISKERSITHRLGNLNLQLSPQAFVQTNVQVAIRLYETAANWIAEVNPNTLLELFCGQGPFSFFAAKSAKKIVGLEINEEAVQTANATAQALGFSHIQFEQADVAQAGVMYEKTNADLVLVNPPRKGLGKNGLAMIQKLPPDTLIYSSCSVETLAQDLKALKAIYDLKQAQIFDLFPHTEHFEILVKLQKKSR